MTDQVVGKIGNPEIAKQASKGGKARASKRLTLEKVQGALGALATPEDAQRHLKQIVDWCGAGLIRPGLAGAMVRGVEQWVKAFDVGVSRDRVRQLERRVAELTKQIEAAARAQGAKL
jgi:hypothetical protein